MLTITLDVDIESLFEEVDKLQFKEDSTRILMAFDQASKVQVSGLLLETCARFASLRGLPLVNVMVNKLPPGVRLPVHVDYIPNTPMQNVPRIERWHLPIKTNELVRFWDEDGEFFMPLGAWSGPVRYWRMHSAWNLGEMERVHIVVDLDTKEALGDYE